MSKKKYIVSIIVPVLNEEENISIFYQKFIEFRNHSSLLQNYEIIFIDDGSSDNSVKEIKKIFEADKNIKFISFTRNFGVNYAFAAGLKYTNGDCLIFIDADSQYPINILDKLIKKWLESNKIIFAKRIGYKEKKILRFISYMFIKLFNFLSKTQLDFNTSYMCLIDKSVIKILSNLEEKSKYYPALIRWLGHKIEYVDCKIEKRSKGISKIGFKIKSKEALNAITNFTTAPLKLLTGLGLTISIFSMFFGFYILLNALIKGVDVPGYPSIFLSILFMGGLQLVGIGILSEYISKIYDEGKKRPDYIIREKVGFE